ncbi:uncharacterized protein PHACADRAFT_202823 [Phanerochaete carnosa HHB-10118-sp]|uniref:Uncharacterized protein n=1 Tax=Phanerochaete carnosa (strain HHB-10118-sp) TaxID=650164 RepID=K5WE43_PHACS|nr:uncharacterized protein PHACADRAFT_202823 [Phanerochaete carnosa HHB-10118-sp]EKM48432.1 hypothetical protein PHACADRAFT_202823 [Phanerochaete carnosa HHB-10118-sp]
MAIFAVTWVVIYTDPSTHSYSHLGCLEPKVDSRRNIYRIVEDDFADPELMYKSGPLPGKDEDDFNIPFHEIKSERKMAMGAMVQAVHPRILNNTHLTLTPAETISPDGAVPPAAPPHGQTFMPVLGIPKIDNEIGSNDPIARAEYL